MSTYNLNFHFFVVKFSVYLNRPIFIMGTQPIYLEQGNFSEYPESIWVQKSIF